MSPTTPADFAASVYTGSTCLTWVGAEACASDGSGGSTKLIVVKRLRNLEDPQHMAMFLDEARIARRLSHPNIVQTYEIGQENGAQLLSELLSIATGNDYSALNWSPQRKKEKTFDLLLRQLQTLSRQRPAFVVYEDVHWIDPTTHELLDAVIEPIGRARILLVMTARSEFQHPWSAHAHVATLALTRLGQRDCTEMIGESWNVVAIISAASSPQIRVGPPPMITTSASICGRSIPSMALRKCIMPR